MTTESRVPGVSSTPSDASFSQMMLEDTETLDELSIPNIPSGIPKLEVVTLLNLSNLTLK